MTPPDRSHTGRGFWQRLPPSPSTEFYACTHFSQRSLCGGESQSESLGSGLTQRKHGEEFETGMRSDERLKFWHIIFLESLSENYTKNRNILHQTVRVSWFPCHSIGSDVASNKFPKMPTLQVVSTAVFE